MHALFVRTILAACVCAALSYSAGAQGTTGSHEEQARFLLNQIERQLSRIQNFRCHKATPLAPLPGALDSAIPRYRHEWLAADRQGRGRIKTSEDGTIITQIWDGQKTIEHREDIDPNGAISHQVFVAQGTQFQAQRFNEPWVYLGSDLANLLTKALNNKYVIRVSGANAGHYRLDIRDDAGSMHTAILDPLQGYAPIYRRLFTKGKLKILETVTFEEVGPIRGIWFPVDVQTEVGPQETRLPTPTLKFRFTDIAVNNYDFEKTLKLGFAAGTRVYDRIRGQTYIVGADGIEPVASPAPAATDVNDPPTPPEPNVPSWRTTFDAAYRLEDGQALKCIVPPFIPERTQYLASVEPDVANQTDRTMQYRLYHFLWGNGLEGNERLGKNRYLALSNVLEDVVGLHSYEYEGGSNLLKLPLTGDWIVRKDAPTEQRLDTLEQIVKSQRQRSIRFVKQQVDAIVIRVSGTYRFTALPQAAAEGVHIYAGDWSTQRNDAGNGNACGTVARFLDHVADSVGMPIVNDTQSSVGELCWVGHDSAQLRDLRNTASLYNTQLASLLNNLAGQTGLTFRIELGTVDQWHVTTPGARTARSD